jgi:hypothetical protein
MSLWNNACRWLIMVVSLVHLQENLSDAFQISPMATFLPKQIGRSHLRSACLCSPANRPDGGQEDVPGEGALGFLQERQLSLLLDFQNSLAQAKQDLRSEIGVLERQQEHLAQKAAEKPPDFVYEDDDLPTGFDSLPWSEGVSL